jgi:DNA-binding MarR family transcriptional regulator
MYQYDLNESLGHLTSQASRMVLKRINRELARKGLPITSEQFSVLVHVWAQNAQPQYVLADKLFKDKTNIARLLASLESSALVVRIPGQKDAREKMVCLTEQGQKLMEKVTVVVQQALEHGQRGIDERDIAICKDVLRRFHGNLL